MNQEQQKLRASEEARQRHLLARLPIISFELDPDGTIRFVNDAITGATGYLPDELQGKNWWSVFLPGDPQTVHDLNLRLQAGDVADYPVPLRSKDGHSVRVKLSTANLYRRDGSLDCVVGFGAHHQPPMPVEKDTSPVVLDANSDEPQGHALLNSLPTPIAVLDRAGAIITVNAAWVRLARESGVPPVLRLDVGANYLDVCRQAAENGDTDAKRLLLGLRDILDGTRSEFACEYPGQMLTEPRSFMLHVSPLSGSAGGAVLSHTEITDLKRTEAALHQANEQLAKIFHASPVGISISTVQEGRFVDVNESFLKMYEYASRDELIGRTSAELNTWAEIGQRQALIQDLVEGRPNAPFEYPFRTRSGEVRKALTACDLIELDGEQFVMSLFLDITERQQIESALRASEERYRIISELVSDYAYLYRVEADGTWAIEWLVGSPTNLVGYDARELNEGVHTFHPEDQERAGRDAQRTLQGTPTEGDYRLIARDGDIRWVHIRRRPVPESQKDQIDQTDQFVGFYAAVQDITERRQAGQALRESEEKYRTLFEQSNDAIFITTLGGHIITVNQAALDLFGYSREEIALMIATDFFVDTEDRRLFQDAIAERVTVTGYEVILKGRDGIPMYCLVSATLRRSEDGDIVGYQGTIRNITGRKYAEVALRASEERYRAISEMMSDFIYSFDLPSGPGRKLIWLAGAYFEITGYSIEDALAAGRWTGIAHPADLPILERRYETLISNQPDTSDIRIIARNGEIRWLRLYGRPLWDAAQQCVVRAYGAARDITDRKQMEESIQTAYANLERRVEERTSDLANAIEALEREVVVRTRAEVSERRQRRLAEALHDTATLLNSPLKLDEVLVRILGHIQTVIPHHAAYLVLVETSATGNIETPIDTPPSSQTGLRTFSPTGEEQVTKDWFFVWRDTLNNLPLPLRQMVEIGQSLIIPDVEADLAWAELVSGQGIRSMLGAPIRVNYSVVGFLGLLSEKPEFFTPDHAQYLEAFTDQVAIAIQNVQLHEQAKQSAAVEERNRIAHDLHDVVSQILWSANLIADVLPAVWERDPEKGRKSLLELRVLTRGALAEMRTLLLELRPSALSEGELAELVRHLGEAFTGRTGIPVALTVIGRASLLPYIQIALYRIVQEALNNIGRHAAASQVEVELRYEAGEIMLRIKDNGRGFDPEAIPRGHLGLGIMRERVKAVGATLNIDSQLDQGTQIVVTWIQPERNTSK